MELVHVVMRVKDSYASGGSREWGPVPLILGKR